MTKPKTIRIGNKEYTRVVDRLRAFRDAFKAMDGWKIQTKVVNLTEKIVMFKAYIIDPKNETVSVGHAYNDLGKDKSMEKAETCAVGRCLAFFDPIYGGEAELGSYDEMEKAGLAKNDPSYDYNFVDGGKAEMVKNGKSEMANKMDAVNKMVQNAMFKDDDVIPGGKFKGEKWSEQEEGYLKYCISAPNAKPETKARAQAELDNRQEKVPEEFPF